jgi:hypothetical protein
VADRRRSRTRRVHDDARRLNARRQGPVELAGCRDIDGYSMAPNPSVSASNPRNAAG